jgi:NAD(P)H-flavin reductase
VGKVKVIDIGIPKKLMEEEKIPVCLLEKEEIQRWLSIPRHPDTHKGDYGHLLVIAGSVGKTGAAAMACQAALRMGAGLVTLAIPKSLNAIMVDGTGMCGCCRVSVGGKTQFACVDGPEFDASLVDWDELTKRNRVYEQKEKHLQRERGNYLLRI